MIYNRLIYRLLDFKMTLNIICWHKVKWFRVLLFSISNSIEQVSQLYGSN